MDITPIPNSPQERFIKCPVREVGYGGQAGGAKSFGLILDVLHQLNKPGYNAILFRRTYKQLREADGLIDLSKRVYPRLGGQYNETYYKWTFPAYHNNTIRFSHLEHGNDVEGFSGSQYAYIGFDELQNFDERQYLFLFSRNRATNPDITPYVRSTFNPGGVGHYWVKKRFINPFMNGAGFINRPKYFTRRDGQDAECDPLEPFAVDRLFIPSRLEDNPYLYRDGDGDYEAGLHQLGEVDFRRLRYGDWDIQLQGRVYHAFNESCLAPPSYDLDLSKASFYHAHDFGAVNRAWGLFAKIGTVHYLVHEAILPEGTTAARAEQIKAHFENRKVVRGWGGAKSEKQQRADYAAEGVRISEPKITDVDSGVNSVNKMFENGTLKICLDMTYTIDQLEHCVYDQKEQIADKSIWHHLDVLRYFGAGISKGKGGLLW